MQCGHLDCEPDERHLGVDLGLYSVTFNNQLELDLDTLQQFKAFREECEAKLFRYFLEIFDPNVPGAVAPALLPGFINDGIARSLAGVTNTGRPTFLKMVYHGPRAMEELVLFDPHLVVGILGGSAGTTLDAFLLLHEAQKYGAKVALYGRKINHAEHQLAFIQMLRYVADGVIEPREAVRAYHGVLQELKISPNRSLEQDLTLQTNVMSYGGSSTVIGLPPAAALASVAIPAESPKPSAAVSVPAVSPMSQPSSNDSPNFGKMSPHERLNYHQDRLKRLFGEK